VPTRENLIRREAITGERHLDCFAPQSHCLASEQASIAMVGLPPGLPD
jgi:hypothetical protein